LTGLSSSPLSPEHRGLNVLTDIQSGGYKRFSTHSAIKKSMLFSFSMRRRIFNLMGGLEPGFFAEIGFA